MAPKVGGHTIPLNTTLRQELERLHAERGEAAQPGRLVIYSERVGGLTADTVTVWFHTLYHTLSVTGCAPTPGAGRS